MSVKDHTLANL